MLNPFLRICRPLEERKSFGLTGKPWPLSPPLLVHSLTAHHSQVQLAQPILQIQLLLQLLQLARRKGVRVAKLLPAYPVPTTS